SVLPRVRSEAGQRIRIGVVIVTGKGRQAQLLVPVLGAGLQSVVILVADRIDRLVGAAQFTVQAESKPLGRPQAETKGPRMQNIVLRIPRGSQRDGDRIES